MGCILIIYMGLLGAGCPGTIHTYLVQLAPVPFSSHCMPSDTAAN